MKITHCAKVEDCFDGSAIYQYRFDTGWTRSMIHLLEALGRLEYFGDFPRPLFRVTTRAGLMLKGVEGDPACRAIFPRDGRDAIKVEFERYFARPRFE